MTDMTNAPTLPANARLAKLIDNVNAGLLIGVLKGELLTAWEELTTLRDQLAEAQREIELVSGQLRYVIKSNEANFKRAAEQTARADANEKDARRYRLLTNRVYATADARNRQCFVFPELADSRVNLMRGSVAQHLDAAIDAALAKS